MVAARLKGYKAQWPEVEFDLAHCPRCGAYRGVFKRQWPFGLVCVECWERLS